MKTKQLEKLSDFIEKEVIAHVEGVRVDGEYTSEKRRFPDTWYHCGLESNYDSTTDEIAFSTEMIADTDCIDEDGFAEEYENAELNICYDCINDSISVETYSDEESEFMQDILFSLKCRIEEDEDFLKLLRKETSHLRPKTPIAKKPMTNTLVWTGGEHCFCDFSILAHGCGYKYLVKCYPLYDECQDDLGAACFDEKQLLKQVLEFTEAGYAFQVQKIEEEYIEDLKTRICAHAA